MTLNDYSKLVVNTPTRTGSTFLCNQITNALVINDNGIMKTHDPFILSNSKSLQIFILRNPYDSILSMITMDNRNGSTSILKDIDDRIDHFNKMLDSFIVSYQKTIPFLFDQVIGSSDKVVKYISSIFKIDYRENNKKTEVVDRDNFVVTSKPLKFYDLAKEELGNHKLRIEELDAKHDKALELLLARQEELGIKL